MKHLIISREYPPAPGGGIGTYVSHIARLLAESGETVHVIGELCEEANKEIEEKYNGRLIIHRITVKDWTSLMDTRTYSMMKLGKANYLFKWNLHIQFFSWQASLLAEKIVEQEGIDIIEAQDYEAPLYFFQLRRALGFGPKRYPPCFIHLHSPTEFIARYNDWDIHSPTLVAIKRLEDYSIAAADALLCPSRYLAQKVKSHYGLTENSIQVIPLPIGDNPRIEREEDIWEHGTVCYVGRLERRKGVIEWIDAAVTVAHEYPMARFEFIGANTLSTNGISGEEFVWHRIPEKLKERFYFRGHRNRSSLQQYLAKARIAVVPSRWENFPNTCVEAMCSGLPVIASREGGMVEMIEDGATGWLANRSVNGTLTEALAEALMRALETSPKKIAEMGHNASTSIHQICDNKKILENHLTFRNRIVHEGANRSFYLPTNLSRIGRPLSDEPVHRIAQNSTEKGIAIIITCFNTGQFLGKCLQNIKRQTQKPAAVVIVDDKSTSPETQKALNEAQREGWHVIFKKNGDIIPAQNTGIEAILSAQITPLGFSFLTTKDRLLPDFVATCESVLQRCHEVGLVSCWARHIGAENTIWNKPCPSFPYQWLSNEAIPFSAVRTQALLEIGKFRPAVNEGYDIWDLFNAVMAEGWTAVTVPEVLGEFSFKDNEMQDITNEGTFEKMYQVLLERFPDLVDRDSREVILLTRSKIANVKIENSLREEFFQSILAQIVFHLSQTKMLRIFRKINGKIKKNFVRSHIS